MKKLKNLLEPVYYLSIDEILGKFLCNFRQKTQIWWSKSRLFNDEGRKIAENFAIMEIVDRLLKEKKCPLHQK
jgi:hypothetical protein